MPQIDRKCWFRDMSMRAPALFCASLAHVKEKKFGTTPGGGVGVRRSLKKHPARDSFLTLKVLTFNHDRIAERYFVYTYMRQISLKLKQQRFVSFLFFFFHGDLALSR